MNDHKLANVSMNGRIAYAAMCLETFLVKKFPEKDWSIIANHLWKVTNMYWDIWTSEYVCIMPDVLVQYDEIADLANHITEQEFQHLKELYDGITEGLEEDPSDEVSYMVSLPFQIAKVYDGTEPGDGSLACEIIEEGEKILEKNNIPLPDYTKVLFTPATEFNGWGNKFDSQYLSIILKK